jgi:hypothetical protein
MPAVDRIPDDEVLAARRAPLQHAGPVYRA